MPPKRNWLRAVLGIVGAGLVIATFFVPWWQISIDHIGQTGRLDIYPYEIRSIPKATMEMFVSAGGYMGPTVRSKEMIPHSITLAVCALVCLWAGLLKGRSSSRLFAVVGVVLLLDAAAFVYRIYKVVAFGVGFSGFKMQGAWTVHTPMNVYELQSTFLPGLYLAVAAGVFTLLLALLVRFVVRDA